MDFVELLFREEASNEPSKASRWREWRGVSRKDVTTDGIGSRFDDDSGGLSVKLLRTGSLDNLIIKGAGIMVVAHSDSMMSYVSRRLRQLDVDGLLTAICAPQDHGIPATLDPASVRRVPESVVKSRTLHLEFSPGIRKPDPATLAPVFEALDVPQGEALYVGDSLSRDVLLARRAQIADVWARYGSHRDDALYRELLEITYWTEAEVAEEERLRTEIGDSAPSNVINSFAEILPLCGVV